MSTLNKTQRRACAAIVGAWLAFAGLPAGAEVPATETASPPAVTVCAQCGMIEGVRAIAQEGESTGLGTVAGGLLGGLLGRQLGDGGSTLGMLLGMAGGAYAGNKFEQHRNKTTHYEVTVRMDDGTQRVLNYDSRPVWQVGERVRLGSGGLARVGQAPARLATGEGIGI